MTCDGYTIFMRYVGVEAKFRKLTLPLSAGVQELCVAPANFKSNFRKEGEIAPKSREEGEIG